MVDYYELGKSIGGLIPSIFAILIGWRVGQYYFKKRKEKKLQEHQA